MVWPVHRVSAIDLPSLPLETTAETAEAGCNNVEELERLSLDDEIESELKAIKAASIDQMEKRVEALETIIDDTNKREGVNHEQL